VIWQNNVNVRHPFSAFTNNLHPTKRHEVFNVAAYSLICTKSEPITNTS
jgi:hypothetical protein